MDESKDVAVEDQSTDASAADEDDNPLLRGRVAPSIQAIDAASVHRICSGQVILDLATAVKELIENSLDAGQRPRHQPRWLPSSCAAHCSPWFGAGRYDVLCAGATVVEVRFKNHGADLIEVIDNGSGIHPSNHAAIVTSTHTTRAHPLPHLPHLTSPYSPVSLRPLPLLSTRL